MKKLDDKSQKTLEQLKAKAHFDTRDNTKMPSIKRIHAMLDEMGVKHWYYESVHIVESRAGGNTYVNDRHDGKAGKELKINSLNTEFSTKYDMEIDSSDTYYSWNTSSYAKDILQLLNSRKLIPNSYVKFY